MSPRSKSFSSFSVDIDKPRRPNRIPRAPIWFNNCSASIGHQCFHQKDENSFLLQVASLLGGLAIFHCIWKRKILPMTQLAITDPPLTDRHL